MEPAMSATDADSVASVPAASSLDSTDAGELSVAPARPVATRSRQDIASAERTRANRCAASVFLHFLMLSTSTTPHAPSPHEPPARNDITRKKRIACIRGRDPMFAMMGSPQQGKMRLVVISAAVVSPLWRKPQNSHPFLLLQSRNEQRFRSKSDQLASRRTAPV